MSQPETLWFLECCTGCSCCASENHFRGPYRTEADAIRRRESFLAPDSKFWPVASQYAARGIYTVRSYVVEWIPGHRYIMNDQVYNGPVQFMRVDEDGSVVSADEERFSTDI